MPQRLSPPPPPNPRIFFASAGARIGRTSTRPLFTILSVAAAAISAVGTPQGSNSVAASGLVGFVQTDGVGFVAPLGSALCFVGAVEQPPPPHGRRIFPRSIFDRNKMHPPSTVAEGVCPLEIRESEKEMMAAPLRAIDGTDDTDKLNPADPSAAVDEKRDAVDVTSAALEAEPVSVSGTHSRVGIRMHFVFLVHGWLGNEMEMSYIETALEKAISASPLLMRGREGDDGDDNDENDSDEGEPAMVVVHSVRCNNGRTADGIAAGGARLADEIISTISGTMERQSRRMRRWSSQSSVAGLSRQGSMTSEESFATAPEVEISSEVEATENAEEEGECHVSFSVVGNSLGGLYARYALSVLPDRVRSVVLHPNVFCTTATPHLGVASHTFLPLPRVAERVIGRGMGLTGRDLFRLDPVPASGREGEVGEAERRSGGGGGESGDEGKLRKDLIYRMSTEESFLLPLSKFERRIAYANAFRTDFQVPTDTAAFLSPRSDYPHRLDRTVRHDFVATVLHTERQEWRKFDTMVREPSMEDDILTMSTKLDSLGWTKVFVDVRERIPVPSVPLPMMKRRDSRAELKQFVLERRESGAFNDNGVLVESRELVELMNPSERLHFPLGHTVMVANSKSDWYAKLNEQGKPVMDSLAKDLVEHMLRFHPLKDEEIRN